MKAYRLLQKYTVWSIVMVLCCYGNNDVNAADKSAQKIGQRSIQAMGGTDAWNAVRFLRFDFASFRDGEQRSSIQHLWDKWTGQYRIEGTDRDGIQYAVLFNVNTKHGAVYVDDKKVPDDSDIHTKYINLAYRRFINDTYWLVMPFKLFDPGVSLTYEGEVTSSEGAVCDILKLTFADNIGLTPKDVYYAHINQDTHLMDEWRYILGGNPERTNTWAWKNWKRYGDIMLTDLRVRLTGSGELRFPNLHVLDTVPANIFTDIHVPLP